MTYLPYDHADRRSWVLATATSVSLHTGVISFLLGGFDALLPEPEQAPPPPPEFSITLQQLDTGTLAGRVQQEGVVGGLADVGTEVLEAVAGEELALLRPQSAEPAAPDTVSALPAAPAGERLSAVGSGTDPAQSDTASETLAPVAAEQSIGAPPPSLETASPIAPDADTIRSAAAPSPAPISPEARPNALAAPPALQPNPSPNPPTGTSAPSAPRIAAAQALPSAQDLAIGDLIERIRAATAEACLLALPRRDGEEDVGLALIAASDAAIETFATDALTEEDVALRQTRRLIDPRQCPALTFVRQNRDYPAARLGLELDAADVPSGGRLTGVLRGTAGRFVLLLLVDNNGVVQDLQRFMSFSGNLARFEVPVTRVGPQRDTAQLLLAIATDRPPSNIRTRLGQRAENVFDGLDSDLIEGAAVSIVAFDVR